MDSLPHKLERKVVIQAAPETVFRFFTDSARWASWWGAESSIDARPGGRLLIRYPEGTEAQGEVLEISAPRRIVFTYGYASGKPVAPGSTRVTITLEPEGSGTSLVLVHEFDDAAVRDEHVQGWRFQLSLFANVVANEVHAGAPAAVDSWFAAWAITDSGERRKAFADIALPGVRFRDRYSALDGIDDLTAHAGAAQRFMPGVRMTRIGAIRHCQGMVLADWTASTPPAPQAMNGTNVFVMGAGGKIESVTGFSATSVKA